MQDFSRVNEYENCYTKSSSDATKKKINYNEVLYFLILFFSFASLNANHPIYPLFPSRLNHPSPVVCLCRHVFLISGKNNSFTLKIML